MSVATILAEADLSHLVSCFSDLSLQRFRSLLIQVISREPSNLFSNAVGIAPEALPTTARSG